MLVEDAPDTRDLFKMVLEMAGHQIELAESGETCLAKLENIKPDVILMDISLPGKLSGLHVVEKLRADSFYDETPIIALTAHALENDRILSFAAGCDEHISKPVFDLGTFAAVVTTYAEKGRDVLQNQPANYQIKGVRANDSEEKRR